MCIRERGITYIVVASRVLVHLNVKENSIKFIVNIIVNIFNIIENNPC